MTNPQARILVVDDEKLIRWSISERLQRDGYQVESAESGEEALEKLGGTPPDVMLLDVKLTGIDGVQTLQRALALHPDLSVLMMSAHSTVDVAVEAMKHGAIDFLVKPFQLNALAAAVERALATARTRRQIAVLSSDRRPAGAIAPSCRSTAPPCRSTCWRASSSATSAAPSPTPRRCAAA